MKILMTTRSSRFFVVLLHLVGVSTHLPSSLQISGIVGVNPFSIVLESSDPQVLLNDSAYLQPHWLQDTLDQTCLHPMGGFSECGDATLWLVIPKQRRHARRNRWIRWATEDYASTTEEDTKPQGFAIQLVDDNNYPHSIDKSGHHQEDFSRKECLTRRKKDNKLEITSCSQDRAWSWHFNEHGILHFEQPRNSILRSMDKRKQKKQQGLECLWRNDAEAVIDSCSGKAEEVNLSSDRDDRVVQIALIRQATAVSTSTPPEENVGRNEDEASEQISVHATPSRSPISDRLPSQVDIAHSHATGSAHHAELKPAARRTSLSPPKQPQKASQPSLHFLKDTNPILLANKLGSSSASSSRLGKSKKAGDATKPLLHESSSSPTNAKPVIRKIQMNPYIAASKDERWTDPQTGLVYRTDLCEYLGHDRSEVGRHTLTGVGQYMKTVFNIKVYGVAHYVSKRDILADPVMEKYASLSSEELRQNPDFYQVLRKMSKPGEPNAGSFDRTLFLKINMQLATETMRSSLQADWKMLTEESKNLLIGSSMKPRPASPTMLEIIESEDNPSRCSCAQIAPEGIDSDPDCCARGTELVFTWRKNGDLEVRLNGDFMDSFPRPDIAEAIFFEYFRLDDPMSVDVLDHVVDGFPFLLAPLSQVKGVKTPVVPQAQASPKSQSSSNPLMKAVFGFGDAVSGHAHNLAGLVQSGASELSSAAVNTARSVGDAARNLGEEMDRRREQVGKHVSALAHQALSSFDGRSKALVILPAGAGGAHMFDNFSSNFSADENSRPASKGRTLKDAMMSRFYREQVPPAAPDEIFPMIHPTKESAQRFFIGMVHLYLLLMLIVSFPAHLSTRTKLVIRRSGPQAVWDSENSDSDASSSESGQATPQKSVPLAPMKKKNGATRFKAYRSHIFR